MTYDQLKQSVCSIIRDTEQRLAAVAPHDPELLLLVILDKWPDPDEVTEQVANEAEWIRTKAQQEETNS